MVFPGKEPACQCKEMKTTKIQSQGQEDPLEREMTTHSSILAWEIPWTEESGRLQSMGLQRVEHYLAAKPPAPHALGMVVLTVKPM